MLSTSGRASLSNGIHFSDEDIIRYDPISGEASLYIDGSDVRFDRRNGDIDALTTQGDNLLLSTASRFQENGLRAQNEDIFSFTPTSLGANTAGDVSDDLFFDGSQFDLTRRDLVAVDLGVNLGVG